MINILYKFNDNMVQLNDIDDLMQRAGLSSWGDVIHQKVDNPKCPRCGHDCYLDIVLIKDNPLYLNTKLSIIVIMNFLT